MRTLASAFDIYLSSERKAATAARVFDGSLITFKPRHSLTGPSLTTTATVSRSGVDFDVGALDSN